MPRLSTWTPCSLLLGWPGLAVDVPCPQVKDQSGIEVGTKYVALSGDCVRQFGSLSNTRSLYNDEGAQLRFEVFGTPYDASHPEDNDSDTSASEAEINTVIQTSNFAPATATTPSSCLCEEEGLTMSMSCASPESATPKMPVNANPFVQAATEWRNFNAGYRGLSLVKVGGLCILSGMLVRKVNGFVGLEQADLAVNNDWRT